MTPAERKRMRRERARATEAEAILGDDRFKAMFQDERFQVDQESAEYRILHPNAERSMEGAGSLLHEHYDEEEGDTDAQSSEEEEDSADERNGGSTAEPSAWGMDADIAFGVAPRRESRKRMLVEKDDMHASAFTQGISLKKEMEMPLGERLEEEQDITGRLAGTRGARAKTVHEMTFEVETSKGKKQKKGGGRRTEGLHRRSASAIDL